MSAGRDGRPDMRTTPHAAVTPGYGLRLWAGLSWPGPGPLMQGACRRPCRWGSAAPSAESPRPERADAEPRPGARPPVTRAPRLGRCVTRMDRRGPTRAGSLLSGPFGRGAAPGRVPAGAVSESDRPRGPAALRAPALCRARSSSATPPHPPTPPCREGIGSVSSKVLLRSSHPQAPPPFLQAALAPAALPPPALRHSRRPLKRAARNGFFWEKGGFFWEESLSGKAAVVGSDVDGGTVVGGHLGGKWGVWATRPGRRPGARKRRVSEWMYIRVTQISESLRYPSHSDIRVTGTARPAPRSLDQG